MIKLQLSGMDMLFNVSSLELRHIDNKEDTLVLECSEAASLIRAGQISLTPDGKMPPPPPKVKRTPQYHPTDKLGSYSIEAFLEAGWKIESMLEEGMVTVTFEDVEEVPEVKQPVVPAPPKQYTPKQEVKVRMTALAGDGTLEDYKEAGWTLEGLIEHGYAVHDTPEVEIDKFKETDTYPRKIDNVYYDKNGTRFDRTIHGISNGIPAVKVNGTFKRRRNISDELYDTQMQLQGANKDKNLTPESDILPEVVIGDESSEYDSELKGLLKDLGS